MRLNNQPESLCAPLRFNKINLEIHSNALVNPSTSKQKKRSIEKGKKDLVRVKNLTCCQSQTSDIHGTTALPSYSLPLYVIWALTGAGGEAVVQRVTEGAHGIRPRLAREAGGGGLVHLAAVLAALPRVCVAVTSAAVRVQAAAAGAAVIQLVQGLQGEVEGARLVCADGCLLHGNLLLQRDKKKMSKDQYRAPSYVHLLERSTLHCKRLHFVDHKLMLVQTHFCCFDRYKMQSTEGSLTQRSATHLVCSVVLQSNKTDAAWEHDSDLYWDFYHAQGPNVCLGCWQACISGHLGSPTPPVLLTGLYDTFFFPCSACGRLLYELA